MTVAYVKDRKQFGTPVGAYQAVSHRCAQMLLDTEGARVGGVVRGLGGRRRGRSGSPEAAAMAKAAASDAGREVTAAAIQLHGGIGFTWEADVHWLFKRAQLDAALLGAASTHRARLARIAAARVAAAALAARLVAGVRAGVGERAAVAHELPQVGARPQRHLQHAERACSRGSRCWASGTRSQLLVLAARADHELAHAAGAVAVAGGVHRARSARSRGRGR